MQGYNVRLRAIQVVHEWYDACPDPVVMSTGSLDLLIGKIEKVLQECAEKAPSGPLETRSPLDYA